MHGQPCVKRYGVLWVGAELRSVLRCWPVVLHCPCCLPAGWPMRTHAMPHMVCARLPAVCLLPDGNERQPATCMQAHMPSMHASRCIPQGGHLVVKLLHCVEVAGWRLPRVCAALRCCAVPVLRCAQSSLTPTGHATCSARACPARPGLVLRPGSAAPGARLCAAARGRHGGRRLGESVLRACAHAGVGRACITSKGCGESEEGPGKPST